MGRHADKQRTPTHDFTSHPASCSLDSSGLVPRTRSKQTRQAGTHPQRSAPPQPNPQRPKPSTPARSLSFPLHRLLRSTPPTRESPAPADDDAMSHSHGDTIPLHPSSAQSDMDEIESLIYAAPSATVLPARPPSPPRASIPISTSPPPLPAPTKPPLPASSVPISVPHAPPASVSVAIAAGGFGPPPNTLTEPVLDTVKRDLARIVSNLKLVVFPNPYREDPGKALRDWDLWGPFFFIVFLGLTLSWSASVKKSEVFAVAFAVLAAGAIILTLNVLLLGGHIIFFQSLSLLGYCLFPLDVGALICMLKNSVILKIIVVTVTLAWSSWAAYPFMSAAVNPRRKALALYPVFLMYISVGFLIIAID